jgi:hypothetical protein
MQMKKRSPNGQLSHMNATVVIGKNPDLFRPKGLFIVVHGRSHDPEKEFGGKLRPFA